MMMKKILVFSSLVLAPVLIPGQGLPLVWAQGPPSPGSVLVDPASLRQPLGDTWPTYSGDYTGRRYSALTQINRETVKNLTLAWTTTLDGSVPAAAAPSGGTGPVGAAGGGGRGGGRGGGGGGGGAGRLIIGGPGTGDFPIGGATIKGSILMVDNVLYVTAPDNVWALDARDGREIWRYFWKTRGGTHIGNRGAAIWNNNLYFETPDNYLVSLDARTGKERWHVEIASFEEQYFSTSAPIVVGNHILAGTGNDLDRPGFIKSFDAETGRLNWTFYTVPMKAGDPGLETWPNLDAARNGGGNVWIPGVYDPETRLYIFGTGNPIPAYTPGRGEGDNLYTCALIAINVDTGKMAWAFQTSPHDMHDWDSAQTPILIDAVIDGKPRKLVSTAARNGYFFTLDRVTGKKVVVTKYGTAANWVKNIDKNGSVRRDPAKDPIIPGALVSPNSSGTINWEPPAYSPETGLFYVPERNSYSIFYLTDPDPRGSMGLGGKEEVAVGSAGSFLTAIDAKTGKVTWRRPYPGGFGGGGGGLLATAGKLVFSGDAGGNLVAYDAESGVPLWHSRIGSVSNAPITYMLDGRQYLLVAAGDTLFAFALYE